MFRWQKWTLKTKDDDRHCFFYLSVVNAACRFYRTLYVFNAIMATCKLNTLEYVQCFRLETHYYIHICMYTYSIHYYEYEFDKLFFLFYLFAEKSNNRQNDKNWKPDLSTRNINNQWKRIGDGDFAMTPFNSMQTVLT